MIYVISQIIGFIAFIFSVSAYHKNKKNKILENMILSNILNLIHYFLLNAYSGCITKLVAIIRDILIIKKEKYKFINNIVLYLLLIIYFIIGIITFKNIYSIMPLMAAIIYLIFIWNGNNVQVKKAAFFCYFLWLLYNICVLSIAGMISNIISIISTFIAIKKVGKHENSI